MKVLTGTFRARTTDDHALFDALPLPAVLQDSRLRMVRVNGAYCELTGYSAEELLGADPIDFGHPDDKARRVAFRERVMAQPLDQTASDRRRVVRKDGRTIWVHTRIRRYRASDGQDYWLSQVEDVTEAVERERTIADTVTQFRVLFHESPVPMTLQDDALRMIEVNQAFCEFTGYPASELIGRDPSELAPAEDLEEIRRLRERFAADPVAGENLAVERRLVRKNGRIAMYRVRPRLVTDFGGRRVLLAVLEDLTGVREAEARAAGSARQLEQWFDLSPMGVVIRDSEWRVLRANQAMGELLGYTPEELIGQRDIFVRAAEGADAEESMRLRDVISGSATGTVRVSGRLRRRNGERIWTNRLTRATQDSEGRRIYLTIADDVTKERLVEQQLEQALLQQGALLRTTAAGVAHVNLEGKVLQANPALARMLGRSSESLVGMPLTSLLLDADRVQWPLERARSALNRQGSYGTEASLRTQDGRVIECEIHAERIDPGDPSRGTILTFHDITPLREQQRLLSKANADLEALLAHRRAAEQALAESEVRFRMFAENTDREFFIEDRAEGTLLYLNAASEQFWGFPRDRMLKEPALRRSRVAAESLEAYDGLVQEGRAGQPAERVYRILHPVRGERWFATRVEPARLPSGQEVVYGVTADITERQLQQSRLEQLLLEMSAMMEGTEAGIVYLREGKVVRCNSQLERLFGFRPGTIVGKTLEFPHEPREASEQLAREMLVQLKRLETFGLQREFRRMDGSRMWCSVWARSAEPFRPQAGIVAVLVDITLMKNQEARLRAALAEQELMFNVSDVGVAFVRDGAIVRANAALQSMSGYGEEMLAGLPIQALHPAAGAPEAAAEAEAGSHAAGPKEVPMLRRDGTLFWVRRVTRPVRPGAMEAGEIVTYIDIDDRRRAEEERRNALQQLQLIFDSVFVGMMVVAEDGTILRVNRTMERMFGYERNELVGRASSTLHWVEGHEQETERITAMLEAHGMATFEHAFRRKDGTRVWAAGNVVTVGETPGRREAIVAFLDIDARKRNEEELQATRAFLEALFDSIPVGVTVRDARSLKVVHCNRAVTQLLGIPAERLMGRTRREIYPPEEADLLDAEDRLVIESGEPQERERPLHIGASGLERTFRMRTVPIRDAAQHVRYVMTVIEDVTERKAAEERRLEDAIKQRDLLVREVHHRIKNNLQGVAGLLQQIALTRPALADALGEIAGQVQAIAQIHGLQVRHTGELTARSVVTAICESLQRTFGVGVEMELVPPAQPPHGLPEQEAVPLALTINELGTNAIKHRSDPNAPVRGRMEETQTGMIVELRNPGTLPADFDFAAYPPGASGLGLIKALLPRRGARLAFMQEGGDVVARLELSAPALLAGGPASLGSGVGTQG